MKRSPRPARVRLVTFDVYTALLDYEAGLLGPVANACKPGADVAGLVRMWRARQLEYAQISNSLQRGRVPFRVLTRRALEYAFARAGQALAAPDAEDLTEAWNRLPPWPEAAAILAALRSRGHELAVLSNGDEKMLCAVTQAAGLRFDHVMASDHAGHYKPHPAMYALPTQRLGLQPAQVLHVAGSSTDVLGAKLGGLRCAWSNRQGDTMLDRDVRPDFEMRDLSGLLLLDVL